MVYNWDGKEEACYRLYVHERRSLHEVVQYWAQRGFTPSKRAFQTQFKRWGFPGKQSPAYKNPALIARVKELWERNATQRDMLDVLRGEGFRINDRELMRLRSRFKWFLRESRRGREDEGGAEGLDRRKQDRDKGVQGASGNGLIDQLAAAMLLQAGSSEGDESQSEHAEAGNGENEGSSKEYESMPAPPSAPLDPAEALRRQLRQQQLQVESDEKWRARKRRRRTRGWAGLPADAPGEPPRFPSETTLDESKAYLGLDNKMYAQIRDEFQRICRSENVFKKSVAGPEKWAEILQRLVRQNGHLTSVFQEQAEVLQQVDALWKPKNYTTLSLDVVCQDVTKRMRVVETRMSILEAKNVLKLNPSQTREVKHAFHTILKVDHFTYKLEAGSQRWAELKQRWVDGSELLRAAITPNEGDGDGERAHRLRAIEVLARDVMKRRRAEATRLDKEQSGGIHKAAHHGPGPGPAPPSAPSQHRAPRGTAPSHCSDNEPPSTNLHPHEPQMSPPAAPPIPPDADLQIDPSLLLAASDAILPSTIPLQHPHPHQSQHLDPPTTYAHSSTTHRSFPGVQPHPHPPHPVLAPLPVYFRLHRRSATLFPHKTLWLSVLQAPTVEEVKRLVAREHPGSEAVRVEGVVGTRGGEACVGIDDDVELGAYLGHVGAERRRGGGEGRATFVVRLGMGVRGGAGSGAGAGVRGEYV